MLGLGMRRCIIDNKTKYTIICLWKILVHKTDVIIYGLKIKM